MAIIKKTRLKDYIVNKLGGGHMCVELTASHLDSAVDDGMRWYSARLGKKKKSSFSIVSGIKEYDVSTILSADEYAELISINKLWLPTGSADLNFMLNYDFLGLSAYPVDNTYATRDIMSSVVQSLQYREQLNRVFGAEISFEYDFETGILLIMPEKNSGGTAIFEYKRSIVDGDRLRPREEDLLMRICLTFAKETLGRIRSKYDNIPVPGGSVVLDGITLLDEAKSEFDILHERARDINPTSFITG